MSRREDVFGEKICGRCGFHPRRAAAMLTTSTTHAVPEESSQQARDCARRTTWDGARLASWPSHRAGKLLPPTPTRSCTWAGEVWASMPSMRLLLLELCTLLSVDGEREWTG